VRSLPASHLAHAIPRPMNSPTLSGKPGHSICSVSADCTSGWLPYFSGSCCDHSD
jgi:hypothetical protein